MASIRKRATNLLSSSSSSPRKNRNVFLSFRGEDTRKSFTDHLYNALKLAGVQAFIDNNDLPRGKEISPGLQKAIQESRVCIVIFSKNYASSKWCLDELVEILEYKKKKGLIVLPVFYNVNPSFFRHQTVNFDDADELHKWFGKCSFVDDQMKRQVEMWGAALHEAASISGYCLDKDANGHEARLVEKIVQGVLHVIDPKKKSKYPKIVVEIKPHLPSLVKIKNNVSVSGIRVPAKTIVSNGIVKIVSETVASHGILVEAATTMVAKVVIHKVSDLLKL